MVGEAPLSLILYTLCPQHKALPYPYIQVSAKPAIAEGRPDWPENITETKSIYLCERSFFPYETRALSYILEVEYLLVTGAGYKNRILNLEMAAVSKQSPAVNWLQRTGHGSETTPFIKLESIASSLFDIVFVFISTTNINIMGGHININHRPKRKDLNAASLK